MNLTLDEVIREYLIESYGASQVDARFAAFYQRGVSGMRELQSDVGWSKSQARLDLRANNTAALPPGYVDYFRIGICQGDMILAFSENKNPCVIDLNRDDCGQIQKRTAQDNVKFNLDSHFLYTHQWNRYSKDGQFVGRDFGARGGFPMYGTFQINREEGYVYIESDIIERDSLIIEYATLLPKDSAGNILVHPYKVEALKAWLYWKSIQRQRSSNPTEKLAARQEYYHQKKQARKRINAMTMQEVIAAVRKGYGPAPGI
jgi:hypothetical protein